MSIYQMYVSDIPYVKFLELPKEERQRIRSVVRKAFLEEVNKEVQQDAINTGTGHVLPSTQQKNNTTQ